MSSAAAQMLRLIEAAPARRTLCEELSQVVTTVENLQTCTGIFKC
jgi:hypothetical protein